MKTGKDKPGIVYLGRYNDSSMLSGPEKTAKRIFDIHSKNNKTTFVQYFFDGRTYGLIKKLFGKESIELNDNSVLYTVGLFRIIPLLFNLKPDLIHIITYERFTIFAVFYRIFKKVKIIYNEHGIIAFENNVIKHVPYWYKLKDRFCERMLLKYSDKIVFLSERSIDIAGRYFKIDESKALIFSNGIDEEFHFISSNKLVNNSKALNVVILNNSDFQTSGISFLTNILSELEIALELFAIGGGTNIDIENEKISIQYFDKMELKELADFYKDKDVFLSLKDFDTFSIASVEAMAAGLIPIVTKETGMSRFIINGENGYSVEYGNRDEVIKILSNISLDSGLKMRLSRQCSLIYDMLSWEDVYESYNNLYQSLSQ
jgi:glycosyltransferase involved in cell wall biosynthesis